jgi:hypothetical protein
MSNLSKILRTETEAICYTDGRMVGSDGHERAKIRLKRRLEEIGCKPYIGRSLELPYQFKGKSFCNLVGRIPGANRKLPPVLIGAHYDSVIPFPCADDNAAAVAIALQAGAMVSENGGFERDVVIALFDAEEPPYFLGDGMGSHRFYEDHVHGKREIHAAIIMDLVGHDISVPGSMLSDVPFIGKAAALVPGLANMDLSIPSLSSLLFVTGSESHEEMEVALDSVGHPDGLKIVPTLNRYIGDMSDHGVFRRNGVPYFFLSCGQWAHYHSPTDTPDRLNYDKMSHITRYVVELAGSINSFKMEGRLGKERTHDTIELEVAYLRQSLGILYEPLIKWFKMKSVSNRREMNGFVNKLLSLGLC